MNFALTALEVAAQCGLEDMVDLLRAAGADESACKVILWAKVSTVCPSMMLREASCVITINIIAYPSSNRCR